MQELAKSVREAASGGDAEKLEEAARDWAAHALVTYRGKLLRRALGISQSLIDFVAEMRG